jgi:hypothetical protein
MSTGDPFHLLRTAWFRHCASTRLTAQSSIGIIAYLKFADHDLDT